MDESFIEGFAGPNLLMVGCRGKCLYLIHRASNYSLHTRSYRVTIRKHTTAGSVFIFWQGNGYYIIKSYFVSKVVLHKKNESGMIEDER